MKARHVHIAVALTATLALPACGDMFGGSSNRGGQGATRTSSAAPSVAPTPAVSNDMIRQVQARLQNDGYYRGGDVDGVWGPTTESAVMAFQRDHNLNVTGKLDGPTLATLNVVDRAMASNTTSTGMDRRNMSDTDRTRADMTGSMSQDMTRRSGAPALSVDMVRQVQSRLQNDGYYRSGNIDGIWGPATASAVTAFQRDRNMNATGRLDAPTLAALNIGESPFTNQPTGSAMDRTGTNPGMGQTGTGQR